MLIINKDSVFLEGSNFILMKKVAKKVIAIVLTMSIAIMMLITGTTMAFAETSTGVGLAAHALKAYREGWSYVWGGTSYGAVDCSGLIYSYNGVGGIRTDMLASSSEWGYVSNGIPNIHGLGLHQPGHIGVYIGSGMAVDARDENSGMVYHNVYNKSWVEWFKVAGVSYPSNGWVLLDGDSYYYENGEYLVNTSRTLDGVTYSFDGSGVSNIAPPSSAYEATDYSSSSNNQNNQVVQESSEEEPSVEPEPEPEPEPESSVEESYEEPVEESSEESVVEESSEPETSVEESSDEESKPEEPKEEVKTIASYGDEDKDDKKVVSEIQGRLYELGYLTDKPSGYYGEGTLNAVMLFQNNNKLEVTGITDSNTYKVLNSDEAKSDFKSLEQGTFDDGVDLSVTALQTRLAELEYYFDDVTGFYGELTKSAVTQFQKTNNINPTGIADAETQEKIFTSKAVKNPNAGSVSFGQSGAMVLKMQKRLIELRYLSGIVNERFDRDTLNAVNAYQKQVGIEVSNTMTAEQLEALYSEDAPKSADFDTLKYGYSGDDVAELQSRLASLKYYDRKTSGNFSQAVVEAVKAFQEDYGLEVTGNADSETREVLKTEAQRASSQVGEQLILQTATIADNALAGIADSKSAEIAITAQSQNDIMRTVVILGSVLAFAVLLSVIFIVELKKRKKIVAVKADTTNKRKF